MKRKQVVLVAALVVIAGITGFYTGLEMGEEKEDESLSKINLSNYLTEEAEYCLSPATNVTNITQLRNCVDERTNATS